MERKSFTSEEIIADAQAQMDKLSEGRKVTIIPREMYVKSRQVIGKKVRVKTLTRQLAEAQEELAALQKEIATYLLEHPSGFYLGSTERPFGTGIRRQADFTELGGEPEIPLGAEAKRITRWIRTAGAKRRYKYDKEKSAAQIAQD